MSTFNVIIQDFNSKEFIPYDIMPYLERCYKEAKDKPKTIEECTEFIDKKAKYRYWSRCEYEVILQGWPNSTLKKKIDVYTQIQYNLNIIVDLFIKDLKIKVK
jgi:hypothetical protein